MGLGRNELRYGASRAREPKATAAIRQDGSRPADWSVQAALRLLYVPLPWMLRLIVAVHFRRMRVRHRGRLPERGAVLLVSNHPATWTDVIVLSAALGRRLHFLAHETLFRPRARAWILRLFGALPVAKRGDPPGREERNALTFRRCRALLARGEVVALFPEGVSATDRSVGPLRTGAARIALDHVAHGGVLSLIPVGLHYADRTAFRSDVVVSIGRPLHVMAPSLGDAGEAWIRDLTARLRTAIAGLIVETGDPSLRWLVDEVTTPARAADARVFENLQRVARGVARLRRRSPPVFAAFEFHAWRHRWLRERLHLATGEGEEGATVGRAAAITIAALPAAAGLLLNVPPAALVAVTATLFSPSRVAMARVVAGLACFTAWYASIPIVVAWITGSWGVGLAATFAAAGLGALALIWTDAWTRVRGAARLHVMRQCRPRLVDRFDREREVLEAFREGPLRAPRRRAFAAGAIP